MAAPRLSLVENKETVRDLRRENRADAGGMAILQVVDATDENLVGMTFRSTVLEVSPSGMRLTSETLIENCKVDVWISIDGFPQKLFLTSEVRWSSLEDEGECQLGLEIIDNPLTDVDTWCQIQRCL
ncbi:MAG: PilZ domain-containing protein [Pseudomonadota bacterium]